MMQEDDVVSSPPSTYICEDFGSDSGSSAGAHPSSSARFLLSAGAPPSSSARFLLHHSSYYVLGKRRSDLPPPQKCILDIYTPPLCKK